MTNKEVLEAIVDLREKIAEAENITLKIRKDMRWAFKTFSVYDMNDLSNARTFLQEADELVIKVGRRWN